LRPQLQLLDNECSDALKHFLVPTGYQLVPPRLQCAMRLNALFARLRIILSLAFAALTNTFPFTCGTNSSHRPR
jgi:hypothetical protein